MTGAVVLSACGGEDDPKPVSGPAKDVAATVSLLERATAKRDFQTICDRVFTRTAREQAGGSDCAALLKRTAGDVRRPRIEIKSIRVKGENAVVAVDTTAAGQKRVPETIELVRKGRQWRVSALADRSKD